MRGNGGGEGRGGDHLGNIKLNSLFSACPVLVCIMIPGFKLDESGSILPSLPSSPTLHPPPLDSSTLHLPPFNEGGVAEQPWAPLTDLQCLMIRMILANQNHLRTSRYVSKPPQLLLHVQHSSTSTWHLPAHHSPPPHWFLWSKNIWMF